MSDAAPAAAPASLRLAPPPAPRVRRPMPSFVWRLQQLLSNYLPLLLMAFLASLTWWLVKHSPAPEAERAKAAPRHVPDYEMKNFELQRFRADGSLSLQIKGREMRHYPDTDTIEIDDIELRAPGEDGMLTTALARQGISNADGSEVQLLGEVQVKRMSKKALPETPPDLRIDGEFLHFFARTEQLKSHRPVLLRTPGASFKVQAFEFDNLTGLLHWHGASQATVAPPGKARKIATGAPGTPPAIPPQKALP